MIRTHICPGGWPEMGCAERCPMYGSRQCVRLSQLTQVWVAVWAVGLRPGLLELP